MVNLLGIVFLFFAALFAFSVGGDRFNSIVTLDGVIFSVVLGLLSLVCFLRVPERMLSREERRRCFSCGGTYKEPSDDD